MRKIGLAALAIGTLVAGFLAGARLMQAQGRPQVIVIQDVIHVLSPKLGATIPIPPQPGLSHSMGLRNLPLVTPQESLIDSALQETPGKPANTTPAQGIQGVGAGLGGYSDCCAPPDTNGAVGATQFVQWVNTDFAVFSKSDGSVQYGPAAGNSLWQTLGGACASNNSGDPIAQYDKLIGRWVMMQPVFTSPYYLCVAVSTTSDATGSYYLYQFAIPNNYFPDYPKLGVWPDAYYVSYNAFQGNTFKGATACALDRNSMMNGNTATMQCFPTAYAGLLPSDLDGASGATGATVVPPAGSPNYYLNFTTNALNMWKFHVDWSTPSNSTFTGPVAVQNVASFTSACNGGTCIPQSGTSEKLDSLGDRLMYRLAYRNFGAYESLVVNHSVATSSGNTGVRWYEIRSPGTAPTVNQQGTFAPDSSYRWMGSIAMDQAGDMALGYSVSSGSMHPAIRHTGRVPSDPAGTMEAETSIIEGTGSQGRSLSRWGDYSSMAVDPTDDCTFWYTNEYLKSNGTFNWSTTIASFKFSSCGSTTPTLSSVSLSPTSVMGGTPSTGTVTLSAAAAADTLVTLSSSNTSAATAPANVTVLAGATTATFPVTTYAVSAVTSVTIGGNYNGSRSAVLTVNNPAITNVAAGSITASGAAITWATNVAANSQVEYGPTITYGHLTPTPPDANLVTSHSEPVSGLAASTLYHYRVHSTDSAGDAAVSGDFTFTTAGSGGGGGTTTVTFDDLTPPNRVLSGQYPTGVIDWGSGTSWWLSAPWGLFTTNSISFNSSSQTSGSFTFLASYRLVSLQAYNGGSGSTTVTISCSGQTSKQSAVAAGTVATISTGWSGPCSPVTLASANGWNTNFDNLVIDSPTAATLTSIAVTPANPSVAKGIPQQFTATGTYSDNSTQNLTSSVTWSSSNTAVATISSAGLASTLATGTSTIQAASGSITGSTTLTVTPAVLSSIAVTPVNPSVAKGNPQQFTATGTFSDGSTQNLTSTVTWSSSNTAVATISSAGLASALATGSSTIQAASGSITGSTTLTVTLALSSIAVTPANPSVAKGIPQQFTATGTYSDNSTQNLTSSVTWSSSNTAVATISSAGLSSTVGTGTSTIQAASGSITGSTTLTVTPAVLSSIAVTPANPSVANGASEQFTATGTFSDGSTQNLTSTVTWSSSNTAVATISSAGLASTLATGSSTIRAASGSITGSTTLTVTSSTTTITFNDLTTPNRVLSGQYPTGVIDWGSGTNWWLSAPWGQFTTNSISFNGSSQTSGSFTFLSSYRLVNLQAYNGGSGSTTVTISCSGQTSKQATVAASTVVTISTGWTAACSPVTISNTNGWNTNFDNLVIDSP